MAKPSDLPEWASSPQDANDIVVPSAGRKQTGWHRNAGVPEKPPYQFFNWFQNCVFRWLSFVDETIDQSVKTTSNPTFNTVYLSTISQKSVSDVLRIYASSSAAAGGNISLYANDAGGVDAGGHLIFTSGSGRNGVEVAFDFRNSTDQQIFIIQNNGKIYAEAGIETPLRVSGSNILQIENATYKTLASSYATLNEAVTAIGSTVKTLFIDVDTALTPASTITIPTTLRLVFENKAKLTGTASLLLGECDAGNNLIFDSTLTVSFNKRTTVNAAWFGASHNTVSNEQINRAIVSISTYGGTVELVKGKFIVGNSGNKISLKSGVNLEGKDGELDFIDGTYLELAGTSYSTFFSNSRISNLKIGTSDNSSVALIYCHYYIGVVLENLDIDARNCFRIDSCTNVTVKNCKAHTSKPLGGANIATIYSSVPGEVSKNVVVDSSFFYVDGGENTQGFLIAQVVGCTVSNCVAYGFNSEWGAGFLIETTARQVKMIGCVSRENTKYGVYAEGDGGSYAGVVCLSISNCSFYLNGLDGLRLDTNFNDVVIDNCQSYNNTGNGFFVATTGANNFVTISNCVADSNALSGIYFLAAYYVTLNNNFLTRNTRYGLELDGVVYNAKIAGNLFASNTIANSIGTIDNASSYDKDKKWTEYSPVFYLADNSTVVTPTSVSAKFKRDGSICFLRVRAVFSGGTGSVLNAGTYVTLPIIGDWPDGSTGDEAQASFGIWSDDLRAARGSVSGLYSNIKVNIANTTAGTLVISFTIAYPV